MKCAGIGELVILREQIVQQSSARARVAENENGLVVNLCRLDCFLEEDPFDERQHRVECCKEGDEEQSQPVSAPLNVLASADENLEILERLCPKFSLTLIQAPNVMPERMLFFKLFWSLGGKFTGAINFVFDLIGCVI